MCIAEEIDQWLRRRSTTATPTFAPHVLTPAQRRNMARERDRNPIERWDQPVWHRWSTCEIVRPADDSPAVA